MLASTTLYMISTCMIWQQVLLQASHSKENVDAPPPSLQYSILPEKPNWHQVHDNISRNHDACVEVEEGQDVDGASQVVWLHATGRVELGALIQDNQHECHKDGTDAEARRDELHKVDKVSLPLVARQAVVKGQPRELDEHIAHEVWWEDGEQHLVVSVWSSRLSHRIYLLYARIGSELLRAHGIAKTVYGHCLYVSGFPW